jgi:hypothetical protein
MSQEVISNLKVKCLEIAQLITHADSVQAKAEELFKWVITGL